MKQEYELAEQLIKAGIKNIDNEKKELALKALNEALKLYNEYILTEQDVDLAANLYFQRSKIYNHLGVGYKSNFYLDTKFAMKCGNIEATKIFNSKKFKDDNFDDKITFVFEISKNEDNDIELSSLFLKGYNNWIDKVKIVNTTHKNPISLTNFNITIDDDRFNKIKLRLLHGILFSDEFICNDLNKTQLIISEIIKNQTIDYNLKSEKGKSLIEEIEKLKKYKTKNNNSNDSFNTLFNKNIEDFNNSEINTNILAECYGFLTFIKKYSAISKNNETINNFLNITQ